jgi:hypothetical protein
MPTDLSRFYTSYTNKKNKWYRNVGYTNWRNCSQGTSPVSEQCRNAMSHYAARGTPGEQIAAVSTTIHHIIWTIMHCGRLCSSRFLSRNRVWPGTSGFLTTQQYPANFYELHLNRYAHVSHIQFPEMNNQNLEFDKISENLSGTK